MDLNAIISIVSDVTCLDISKNTRKREYIYARAIYYKIARDLTPYSLSDIGKPLDKDHATVLFHLKHNFEVIELYEKKFLEYYKTAKVLAYNTIVKSKEEVSDEVTQNLENYFIKENQKLTDQVNKLTEELNVLKATYKDDQITMMLKRVPSKNMKHFLFRLDNLTDIMAKL